MILYVTADATQNYFIKLNTKWNKFWVHQEYKKDADYFKKKYFEDWYQLLTMKLHKSQNIVSDEDLKKECSYKQPNHWDHKNRQEIS